mmetsp:Transcript_42495/g.128957  ORF Transcript_42495/g.128957 Transcript_42495/m.128957 type:complete len:101 (-) Transcript_42495:141-443(-)
MRAARRPADDGRRPAVECDVGGVSPMHLGAASGDRWTVGAPKESAGPNSPAISSTPRTARRTILLTNASTSVDGATGRRKERPIDLTYKHFQVAPSNWII